MKKNLILLIFILAAHCAWSQDVIIMRSGDEVKAKVTEVSDYIKYKKADNPEGPDYSVRKTEVFMIKYANGTKDVFSDEKQPESPVNVSMQTKTPEKKSSSFIKYTNLTQLGFAFGVGANIITSYNPYYGGYQIETYKNKTDVIRMTTVNGIMIGSYFSTGIGMGLDYYFYRSDNSFSVPVYLDLRVNILGDHVTPVVFFDIGNSFKTNAFSYSYSGLMLEPGFGIKIPAGAIAVNFSFSYLMQKSSETFPINSLYSNNSPSNYTYKFINFKMGISF